MRFIDREEVARRLTYEVCIPLVRDAMIAFSAGETRQLLRSIIPLADGHLFGIMPGALGANAPFGAKLISIFPENAAQGRQSHQGLRSPNQAPTCYPFPDGEERRPELAAVKSWLGKQKIIRVQLSMQKKKGSPIG